MAKVASKEIDRWLSSSPVRSQRVMYTNALTQSSRYQLDCESLSALEFLLFSVHSKTSLGLGHSEEDSYSRY